MVVSFCFLEIYFCFASSFPWLSVNIICMGSGTFVILLIFVWILLLMYLLKFHIFQQHNLLKEWLVSCINKIYTMKTILSFFKPKIITIILYHFQFSNSCFSSFEFWILDGEFFLSIVINFGVSFGVIIKMKSS